MNRQSSIYLIIVLAIAILLIKPVHSEDWVLPVNSSCYNCTCNMSAYVPYEGASDRVDLGYSSYLKTGYSGLEIAGIQSLGEVWIGEYCSDDYSVCDTDSGTNLFTYGGAEIGRGRRSSVSGAGYLLVHGPINSTVSISSPYYYGNGQYLTGLMSYGTDNDTIINASNILKVNTTKYYLPVNDSANSFVYLDNKNSTKSGAVWVGEQHDTATYNAPTKDFDNLISFKKIDSTGQQARAIWAVAEYNGSVSNGQALVGLNAGVLVSGDGNQTQAGAVGLSGGRVFVRNYGKGNITKATGYASEINMMNGGTGGGGFIEGVIFRALNMSALTGSIVDGYGLKLEGAGKSATGVFTNYYGVYHPYVPESTTTTPTNYYSEFFTRASGTGVKPTNGIHFGEKGTVIFSPMLSEIQINSSNLTLTGGNTTFTTYYGSLYNASETGYSINLVTTGVYVNISGLNIGDANGCFRYGVSSEGMKCNVGGTYKMDWSMTFEGSGEYGGSIFKNGVEQADCYDLNANPSATVHQKLVGSCFVNMNAGDTINIMMDDHLNPVNDPTVHTVHLTMHRMGI